MLYSNSDISLERYEKFYYRDAIAQHHSRFSNPKHSQPTSHSSKKLISKVGVDFNPKVESVLEKPPAIKIENVPSTALSRAPSERASEDLHTFRLPRYANVYSNSE